MLYQNKSPTIVHQLIVESAQPGWDGWISNTAYCADGSFFRIAVISQNLKL